jgi:hypothetical protein
MWNERNKINNYSILRIGSALILAAILVISTVAYSFGTSADGNRNSPPNAPSNPFPANESVNVSTMAQLFWTGGDPDNDTVTYNVFFGLNQTPPQVATNISTTVFNPGIMNFTTKYYWRIIAWDNQSDSTSGPLWDFTTRTNHPPNEPNSPDPANGSTNVSVLVKLSWAGGDPDGDATTYNVFFGTNQTPPQIATNISTTTFNPGKMNFTTKYYWRIIAWDNHSASTLGPLWELTTGVNHPPNAPDDPHPVNESTNVSVNTFLSWTGGDPDNDTVTYDIFFGTDPNPPEIVGNHSSTTYTFSAPIAYDTLHYWRIVAWDSQSVSTNGPLWMFTTAKKPTTISVSIAKPLNNSFYLNDQRKFSLPNRTIVYGSITITANVTADAGVARVDFYIDGNLKGNDTTAPYEFVWDPFIQFNGLSLTHSIKVIATDVDGKNATAEINVTKWRFHVLPVLIIAVGLLSTGVTHTTMKGFVLNLRETTRGYTFFAIRMKYHTVGLFRNQHGLVQLKRCEARVVIGPTTIIRLGPLHGLAYLSVTFLGSIHIGTSPFGGLFNQNPKTSNKTSS